MKLNQDTLVNSLSLAIVYGVFFLPEVFDLVNKLVVKLLPNSSFRIVDSVTNQPTRVGFLIHLVLATLVACCVRPKIVSKLK